MLKTRLVFAGGAAAAAMLMSACADNPGPSVEGDRTISVDSGSDTCTLSATEAPSGDIVFKVTNSGDEVTEFYLLASDGLQIVGEVENIGPGITRDLVVQAEAGDYISTCKPGMVGQGIRAPFTVTESGTAVVTTGSKTQQLEKATNQYAAYVKDQSAQLLVATKAFAKDYVEGNDDVARTAYAPARMHWEGIEPVAESFGDLDPRLDLREADLKPGQKWTGWHAIEKDLWPPSNYQPFTTKQRQSLADQLVTDTETLDSRVQDLTYTPAQLGNGAKELLDEVATGKVTGEEEFWSHTDLWDFQANVDGARVAYEGLRPVVKGSRPDAGRHPRQTLLRTATATQPVQE